MKEYHKIQSLFKRDEKTHKFIEGQWSLPEFEYLQDNRWVFTEKIHGTNIRVIWDGEHIEFKGRTDKAEMYPPLLAVLVNTFLHNKVRMIFNEPVCLYGEGYGAKIQKGGGNYRSDVGFILFDVRIGDWWLRREDIFDIATQFEIPVVPIVAEGSLDLAVKLIKAGTKSTFGAFQAEGFVLKPKVELFARNGERIISKIKHKDFAQCPTPTS